MKTAHQALTEARALIADPAHWTQHAFARRTKNGGAVYSKAPEATCFCALGALNRVVDTNSGTHPAYRLLTNAAGRIEPEATAAWVNDRRGHEAVLKMYDYALEASKP